MLREAVTAVARLAENHNNLAWLLATGPEPFRNPTEAVEHARHAVRLARGGDLAQHAGRRPLSRGSIRRGDHDPQESLAAGHGQTDAFDLFFLAMAHHRLGDHKPGPRLLPTAPSDGGEQKNLTAQYPSELVASAPRPSPCFLDTPMAPPANVLRMSVHRCSCRFCSDLCARAGTFANGRPLVLQVTSPGSFPLRAA